MSFGFQDSQMPIEESGSTTAKYTLPGIMQYLQTQFSQAERNRMQNDLEKSSLKLKIIELEHERNALTRRNLELEQEVAGLKAKFGINTPVNGDNEAEVERKGDDDENNAHILNSIESIDVEKLVKAKQFLKSATNEIIYLLKSPLLELDEHESNSNNELFTNIGGRSANGFNKNGVSVDKDGEESPYSLKDVQQAFSEPFKSIPDSDQETIIDDEIINNNTKEDEENMFHILKKANATKPITQMFDIKLKEFKAELELKSNKLSVYYQRSNTIDIFDINSNGNEFICTIELPPSDTLVDVISNSSYIVVLTKTELIVYPLIRDPEHLTYACESSISLDLDGDEIVVVKPQLLEKFDITETEIKLVSSHVLDADINEIKKVKFINHHPKYDVAILTSIGILFYNLENAIDNESLQLLSDIPLAHFTEWALTSLNLIVKYDHGIYLLDFDDITEFKNVPTPTSDLSNITIGTCPDAEGIFFVLQNSGLRVFESTSIGTINQIKSIADVKPNQGCCLGTISSSQRVVLAVKNQQVVVHNV